MKKPRDDKLKWYTVNEFIDCETGEIVTKSYVQRNNLKISKKTLKTEIKDGYGIKKWVCECKPNEQLRLF